MDDFKILQDYEIDDAWKKAIEIFKFEFKETYLKDSKNPFLNPKIETFKCAEGYNTLQQTLIDNSVIEDPHKKYFDDPNYKLFLHIIYCIFGEIPLEDNTLSMFKNEMLLRLVNHQLKRMYNDHVTIIEENCSNPITTHKFKFRLNQLTKHSILRLTGEDCLLPFMLNMGERSLTLLTVSFEKADSEQMQNLLYQEIDGYNDEAFECMKHFRKTLMDVYVNNHLKS